MSASTIGSLLDASAAANGFGSTGKKDAAKELNDRFLKLLVAQMKNQDPLNPLDNAQVTSQMAQINTVTGINGLNETVAKLLEQFGAMEALQASQLTGRNVLVTGNTMTMDAQGTPAVGGIELPASADKVTVEIRDSAGALMRTLQLGKTEGGVTRFSWDGKTDAGVQVAAGSYTVSVKAMSGSTEIPGLPLMARQVEAVTRVDGATQLVLAGGTRVAYGDVKQILS
jgi:flagellar basal-body rod modification protein FlgD